MDTIIPTTSKTGKQQISCPPADMVADTAGEVFVDWKRPGHMYSVTKASTIVNGKLISSPIPAVIAARTTASLKLIMCFVANRANNTPAQKKVKTFNARITMVKKIVTACASCVFIV
jgi:hypothetical protein